MLVTKARHDGQIELEPRKVQSPSTVKALKAMILGLFLQHKHRQKTANQRFESLLIVPLTNGNDVGAISIA